MPMSLRVPTRNTTTKAICAFGPFANQKALAIIQTTSSMNARRIILICLECISKIANKALKYFSPIKRFKKYRLKEI